MKNVFKKIAVITLLLAMVLCLSGCDSSDYKKAVSLMESGDYAAAEQMFTKLGDYEDSAEKILECRYALAVAAFEKGEYELAISAFEALDSYNDSAEKVLECRYALAVAAFEKGEYELAISAFEALGNYKDCEAKSEESKTIITEQKYNEAVALMSGGKYVDAGFWYFSTPKHGSQRTIDIDSQLTDLLKREYDRQEKAKWYFEKRYRRYYEDSHKRISEAPTDKEIGFVCRRENGEYVTSRTMQHATQIIHNQLKLPEYDFHSLRHTHATMLVENGAPLKYVQKRLGHKKIDVTMNIYQHLTESLREQGKVVIENMY